MVETSTVKRDRQTPTARYAYYRRCQEFRRNGEQCKAPAEKGTHVCHAHAGQRAMAVRRERERLAVLAEAVEQMRRRGRPGFEMADLFMDFKGIQVTIAVMARALIDGRIDCKTAGKLAVDLQRMSKLLWMVHKKCKTIPRMNTDNTDLRTLLKAPEANAEKHSATNRREKTRITEVTVFKKRRGWANGAPEWVKAA